MIFHENEKCPVCDKVFTEDDDIVTCPHCGTPHHRECYTSLGRCVNHDKHKDGFEYSFQEVNEQSSDNNDSRRETNNLNPNNVYYQQDAVTKKTLCSSCGEEIAPNSPFCPSCGAKQENPVYDSVSPVGFVPFNGEQQAYADSSETIEGKSLSDVASVVRTNTGRFIPKFIQNKKVSWNWSGFIFGPYYLLFRKMYKQGIAALILNIAANYTAFSLYLQQYKALATFMYSDEMKSFFTNPTQELADKYIQLYNEVLPMFLIIGAASLIINLVIALFSDSFYRAKVFSVLNRVDENLNQGGIFSQSIPFSEEQNTISQSDMKKIYLGRMGGTSFVSPFIAWSAVYLITNIISRF